MALISEIQGKTWGTDRYGDQVLSWKWNWYDDHIMRWINNFASISRTNTEANINRLHMTRTGTLKRSLYWKTYAVSGGDEQVFEARYIYYAKYVELAVGKGESYDSPVPNIPGKAWSPIKVPTRRRKGKPHVVTEMRSQAKKFTAYARKHFSFVGTTYMIFAMGNNQSAAAAVNRALFWASKGSKFDR